MDVLFGYLLKPFFLPPGANILLAVLGALLRRRRPRLGAGLLAFALLSLWLLATPYGAVLIAGTLETWPPLTPEAARASGAKAIVVLGGSSYPNAPEYGGSTVGADSLIRIRYAAFLHHELDLPVATVGGEPIGNGVPVGITMAQVLHDEFGVPVQWIEANSRNTAENAGFSQELKQTAPKILLVTHATHMPRAKRVFELAGFEVVPAPTSFASVRASELIFPYALLPSAGFLLTSRDVIHEWVGLLWYRVHYETVPAPE
ncbi:MAG: YdcF family protein [Gammaproteobacteria bacterium]|nr:YdcF family protein [Gammaproteobacteria bacterium]